MARIEQLTEAQAARLPVFRAEYFAHGTSTVPADRGRAEAAFARAYRAIGREPVRVIWVSSPLTASLAFAVMNRMSQTEKDASLGDSLGDSLRASLRDSLGDSLRASLGASLWASLGDSLGASLRASLWDSLGDSLRASLGDSLGDSLRASLRDSLGASLGDSLRASLRDSLGASLWASLRDSQIEAQYTYWWGQQDLYWIALYRFGAEIGVQYEADAADRLDIMREIGMSCMWWYPRDGLIVACDRPSAVHFDERERLHNDNGPAVSFRDGWNIYAVNGVRVPAWLFEEPDRLTLAAIDVEQNAEIQRVMIERFGWDRYAAECGAEIVDHDERWGTLYRRNGAVEPIVFLRVTNRSPEPDGSFRKYVLPVHPECRPLPDPARPLDDFGEPQELTALNAVASTFGMYGREYAAMLGAES